MAATEDEIPMRYLQPRQLIRERAVLHAQRIVRPRVEPEVDVRTAKLGESPAQRTVGFIERAMPADGSSRCPLASNGDVGTSRLEKQL